MHSIISLPRGSALLLTAALLLPAFAQASSHGHGHGHEHAAHEAPARLELNHGKRWETDAALREAMGRINQAMGDALPRIHRHQFGDEAYRALAASIEREIAWAVEHCHLEPRADAMLHRVIAELSAGAESMKAAGDRQRHDGASRVQRALKAYGRYFQHPGWKAARG